MLVAAIGIGLAGAAFAGFAPLVGVVEGGAEPAFTSWPLLLVLAAAPSLLAAEMLRRDRPRAAEAVLTAAAAVVPARLATDAQLFFDPNLLANPALVSPRTLQPLEAGLGAWLLVAGHAAALLAGSLAVLGRRTRPADGGAPPAGRRHGVLAGVLGVSAVSATSALIAAPLISDNPFLVANAGIDAQGTAIIGGLLLAATVPLVGGVAATSAEPTVARGGLLGLAAALAAIALPLLAAGVLRPEFGPGPGAVVQVLAAVAFAVLAVPAGRQPRQHRAENELRLPAHTVLCSAAGGTAIAAGLFAVLAAWTPQLDVPTRGSELTVYSARLLVPAGCVLALLGAGLLHRRWAGMLRPVLGVAWAMVPMAAMATLDTVLTASQATGAEIRFGTWAAVVAIVLSVCAAVTAATAGAIERDEVDLTELSRSSKLLVPAVLVAILAPAAFNLPVLSSPEYSAPGVFVRFDTTSWGLLAALVAVIVAAGLAMFARPPRAAGLLVGAALVLAARAVEGPLTLDRAAESGIGVGVWFALAGVAVLTAGAILAPRTSG